MSAPLSEQQLAEIRGLDLLGLVGERAAGQISAHFAVLLAEVDRLRADAVRLQAVADGEHKAFIDTHNALNLLREDANRVMTENGVQAQQAELERVREQAAKFKEQRGDWAKQARTAEDRVAELEAERYSTNEALSEAAEALRDANTAAGLVAEYRVPTKDEGRWLSVRREPNGDRWCVMAWTVSSSNGRRSMAWVDGRWQVLPAYGENGVWEFGSADAALAEATRLAEAGEPR